LSGSFFQMTTSDVEMPLAGNRLVPFVERRRQPRQYRIAAIDVGTNSIHMIIAEAQKHGYRVIDQEKQMAQLG